MFVFMLAMGAFSSVVLLVAPGLFMNIQRRLLAMIGFPTDLLEPAWQKMPVRLMAAIYLPVCVAGLYYLLVVNPEFFNVSLPAGRLHLHS